MNKNVLIDSLQYNDIDGGDAESVTGYSKELNNYKIKILLDIENDYVVTDEEMDENGSFRQNIWYRDGGNYAYVTYKKDKKFPIKYLLYNRLEFPLLWFLSVFLTFFLNKKYKQLKKIENENKN